jgi:hypothetical protein
MFGFWRKKTETVKVVKSTVTGVLDTKGSPLQEALQSEIATILMTCPSIERAYLAMLRVEGQQDEAVMVGLCSSQPNDLDITKRITQVCASHKTHGIVRVAFLNAENEENLSRGVKPFYSRAGSNTAG